MSSDRRSAVIVGSLFIAATGFYMIGQLIHGPITGSPDYLEMAYPNQLTVFGGIFVELLGVLAIPLIAVYLLPILRKFNQGLAVGYVVFRSIEALLLMGVSICTLSLIRVSQGYLVAAGAEAEIYREISIGIQTVGYWTFIFSVSLVFPITAMMLNTVMYRSRLVPRVISAWGFLGGALLLAGTLLNSIGMFTGIQESILEAVLTIPIAVQEMVLALWLIIKGFNPTAIQ